MIIVKFLLIVFCLMSESILLAQGDVVVNPLSNYAEDVSKPITFGINNRKSTPLLIEYKHICDINGTTQEGAECLKYFDINFGADYSDKTNNLFTIPANSKLDVTVNLINDKNQVKYAIYKPLIAPTEKKTPNAKNTVTFDFNYQPGFLFVVDKVNERIELKDVKYVSEENARRIKTVAELDKLKVPHVISISTKILEKDTKNLVRLVKLATTKIFDPSRKSLELYANFESPNYNKPVCYQSYVQDFITKEVYQLSDCK